MKQFAQSLLGNIDLAILVVSAIAAVGAIVGAYFTYRAIIVNRRLATKGEFGEIRQDMTRHRAELAKTAASYYVGGIRIPGSDLITKDRWIYREPVPLDSIELVFDDAVTPPTFDGTEAVVASYLPYRLVRRYRTYTDAVSDICPPGLWSNRFSYRITAFDTQGGSGNGQMRFTTCDWFDMLNVGEVLATESFLAGTLKGDLRTSLQPRHVRSQPYRRLVGDPTELRRRAIVPSLNVLTLRRSLNEARFLLHLRDERAVAVAPGLTHVIPCGGFQPSSRIRHVVEEECDLWLTLIREYAEEFLGVEEADSEAAYSPDFRSGEPYVSLNQARKEGRLAVHCFGFGLDPLALYGEILAAVVIDDEVFDSVFREVVDSNAEGLIVKGPRMAGHAIGLPFTEETVAKVMLKERWAPAGAACVALAWRHRAHLLS